MDSTLYDNDKEQLRHHDAIQSLAHEYGVAEGIASEVYEEELRRLKAGARIKDYLPLLTGKHVKEVLSRKFGRLNGLPPLTERRDNEVQR